jgi:hypothetical protein
MSDNINWLNGLYKQAFPHLENIVDNKNVTSQFEGVDKWLYCKNTGRPFRIEEKLRNKDYGDLLLEDYSNWDTKRPGWTRDIQKITDYLVYIILLRKTLWIFCYPALRQYFLTNYDNLYKSYVTRSRTGDYVWGNTPDQNGNLLFKTANIPVPLGEFPRNWLLKNFWRYYA